MVSGGAEIFVACEHSANGTTAAWIADAGVGHSAAVRARARAHGRAGARAGSRGAHGRAGGRAGEYVAGGRAPGGRFAPDLGGRRTDVRRWWRLVGGGRRAEGGVRRADDGAGGRRRWAHRGWHRVEGGRQRADGGGWRVSEGSPQVSCLAASRRARPPRHRRGPSGVHLGVARGLPCVRLVAFYAARSAGK